MNHRNYCRYEQGKGWVISNKSVEDGRIINLNEIYKIIEDLIIKVKNDIGPYEIELNRLCIAGTAAVYNFTPSTTEQNRLLSYKRKLDWEVSEIIRLFFKEVYQKGTSILRAIILYDYNNLLKDECVNEIENKIISIESKLSFKGWSERIDSILRAIRWHRKWKNYSPSDFELVMKAKKDKVAELNKQIQSAETERNSANDKIKELTDEKLNIFIFRVRKIKSLNAEIDLLKQKIDDLNAKIKEINKNVADIEEDLRFLTWRVEFIR